MSDDLDNIKKKKLNITIENLVTIGFVIVTVTGMYYSLTQEIELAKELPEPPIRGDKVTIDITYVRAKKNTKSTFHAIGSKIELV